MADTLRGPEFGVSLSEGHEFSIFVVRMRRHKLRNSSKIVEPVSVAVNLFAAEKALNGFVQFAHTIVDLRHHLRGVR